MLRKKIAFSFLMAFVLIFGYFAAVFPVKAATPVIVINPGHLVGRDSGAVNNNTNIQEANLNAALAAMTAEKLKSIGYDVYLTHPVSGCSIPTLLTTQQVNAGYDANSSLKTIGDAINVKNPDLAISIHHNSGGNASGYEFYWSSYRAGIDSSGLYKEYGLWSNGDYAWKDSTPCESAQRSKDFSKLLEKNLDGIGLPFRNTIERDDYIPAHTVCPSVLIEAGFVSNDAESRKLADVNYQNEEANRIVNSINDFFGYKPEISVDSIVASNVSGDGFNVIVSGVKGYGVAAIFIPVWSEAQGQGSTIWHEATRQSDGSYTATIRTSDHGNSSGKYTVLAYGMDTQSQLTGLGSTSVEVPASNSNNENTSEFDLSTKIMGSTQISKERLVNYYTSKASFPQYYRDNGIDLNSFVQMYIDECNIEGVKAEIAFGQMLHETNYLSFGGDVSIEQYNFAGLGATGGVPGNSFSDISTGIRAHVQHLKCYASSEALKQNCVDQRWGEWLRLRATTIGELTGTWATDSRYSEKLLTIINSF